jgi:hypothetical protein
MERNDKQVTDSRSQQVRLIELELDDLQCRQQAAIEQLRKHRGRLAAIEGKVAFVGYGACE